MGERGPVSVAQSALEHEAQMVAQMLAASGFPTDVRGGPLFGCGSLTLPPNATFHVTVPTARAREARELLASVESEYRPEVPESVSAQEAQAPCPVCGSADKAYEAENAYNRWARSGWRSSGWFAPYTWRCANCGHRW